MPCGRRLPCILSGQRGVAGCGSCPLPGGHSGCSARTMVPAEHRGRTPRKARASRRNAFREETALTCGCVEKPSLMARGPSSARLLRHTWAAAGSTSRARTRHRRFASGLVFSPLRFHTGESQPWQPVHSSRKCTGCGVVISCGLFRRASAATGFIR